jgi:PAS domain S-box-containing protein
MAEYDTNAKSLGITPSDCSCPLAYNHAEVRDKEHFVFFDAGGVWLHVSKGMSDLLGYSCEEMVGSTVTKFQPPDKARVPRMLDQFVRDGYMETMFVVRHQNGRLISFRVICIKLSDGCMVAIWYPFNRQNG